MSALPHLLYGPGEDALALTVEYGGIVDQNATQEAISKCLQRRYTHYIEKHLWFAFIITNKHLLYYVRFQATSFKMSSGTFCCVLW